MAVKPRALLAGAVFTGALAAGGVSLAAAQTNSPSTPETTTPDQSTTPPINPDGRDRGPSHDGRNCPKMDGAQDGGGTQSWVSPDLENSI